MVFARCDINEFNYCKKIYKTEVKMVDDCDDDLGNVVAREQCKEHRPRFSTDVDCCLEEHRFCCGPFWASVVPSDSPYDSHGNNDYSLGVEDDNNDD